MSGTRTFCIRLRDDYEVVRQDTYEPQHSHCDCAIDIRRTAHHHEVAYDTTSRLRNPARVLKFNSHPDSATWHAY